MSPVSPVFQTVVIVSIGLKKYQSESIHYIILHVRVLKAEHQNSHFLSVQLQLDKDLMLSPQSPLKLAMNHFNSPPSFHLGEQE